MRGLRAALWLGAGLWLGLLAVGFVAPGGWVWGMPGPIGHIENFMIALWFVTLVVAPLLASRDPLRQAGAVQIYLLGLAGIVVSSVPTDRLQLLSDAVPVAAALLSAGGVILAHPARRQLWRL